MQIQVEVGELDARVIGDRVSLTVRNGTSSVELSLSVLAAHNLGVVMPGLALDASDAVIGASLMQMGGIDPQSGPWVVCPAGEKRGNSCQALADVARNVRVLLDTGHRADVLGLANGRVTVLKTYPEES